MRRLFAHGLLLGFVSACGLTLDATALPDARGEDEIDVGATLDGGREFDARFAEDVRGGSDDVAAVDAPLTGDSAVLDAPVVDGATPDASGPSPCATLPEGSPCGEADRFLLCLGGACVPSSCGDGFVDRRIEDCDPGEPASDPACVACRYECDGDDDCVEGPCQERRCEGHRCVYRPRDGSCRLESGAMGLCREGRCEVASCGNGRVDDGEECDPGSASVHPGCIGCRLGCRSDDDCDDGLACNGTERCEGAADGVGNVCLPGRPIRCDAPSDCHVAICDELGTGPMPCVSVLRRDVDRDGDGFPNRMGCGLPVDCNDDDADVNPGAREVCDPANVDEDCNPATRGDALRDWCPDRDGDGHGTIDSTFWVSSCGTPGSGYTTRCDDCWDTDDPAHIATARLVNPSQRAFFASPYSPAPGTNSFDYDCNGTPQLELPNVERCGLIRLSSCGHLDGWRDRVPSCGAEGQWVDCRSIALVCTSSPSRRTQRCR